MFDLNPTSFDLSADGSHLVTGHADGTLRIWDVHSGATLHVHSVSGNDVTSVYFFIDLRVIYIAGGSIGIWFPEDARSWELDTLGEDIEHLAHFNSPDGTVTLGIASSISVWSTASSNSVADSQVSHSQSIHPPHVELWQGSRDSVETLTCKYVLPEFSDGVSAMVFTPDGTYILIATGRMLQLWNIATGARQWKKSLGFDILLMEMNPTLSLRFNSDCTNVTVCMKTGLFSINIHLDAQVMKSQNEIAKAQRDSLGNRPPTGRLMVHFPVLAITFGDSESPFWVKQFHIGSDLSTIVALTTWGDFVDLERQDDYTGLEMV